MEQARFEQMVARLERESNEAPGTYRLKVAALAALGFLIVGLIIGFAGLGLILLAALVAALAFTGGKALFLLLKLGKLLLLLAIPMWMLVRSSVSVLLTRLPVPQGVELGTTQAPGLFKALADMRQRMHGPRFHHVLITDELNAAVLQRPLFGLFGWPRNYLILGLPLLEALSPDEALAVVAHEYGHLAGSHSRFAAFIYRLRLAWVVVQHVSAEWQGWISRPLQRIVQWYVPYFNAYTFVLARANEYQADAASAELVGASVAASALKRVNIVAPRYERFVEQTFGQIRDREQPPVDFTLQWATQAGQTPMPGQSEAWLRSALQQPSQVSDTHPVLRERLCALPGQADLSEQLPPPLADASAADAWLGTSAAMLRDTLQRQWQERIGAPWSRHHQELQTRMQRLNDLEAIGAPSLDEQIERLQLRTSLYPERDHLEALVAFNAAQPEQAVTLFLEACARLDKDDASGIELLERVIAIDPSATQPASEKASAWLQRSNDARAADWVGRWQRSRETDLLREQQLRTLDPNHALRPAELNAEQLERVRTVLGLGGKGVARAWIARRVLPADDTVLTYVLAIELSGWARWRGKRQQIVSQLSQFDWPMHLFIFAIEGELAAFGTQLKAVAGSAVAFER